MRIAVSLGALALALSGCSMTSSGGEIPAAMAADAVTVVTPPARDPSELQVLFWSDEQREQRFRDMESWFAGHEVVASDTPRELPTGEPIGADHAASLRAYMEETNAAGVMILQDGKVRFEDYRLGFGPDQRWTSFSVAKSFTSTLLGAAIADGFIASIDEPVTDFVPEMAGTSYEGVSILQIAQMTSGVAWNEDYADPNSDVAMMARFAFEHGPDALTEQMSTLEREAAPGEKWLYKTVETNLLGLIVENAVGLTLAEYAKSKIVDPAGFGSDLFWISDPRGGSIGGCCLSITLADYARFGQFALDGGEGIVPDDWYVKSSTPAPAMANATPVSYGYQWWIYPEMDSYGAQGIFGQAITVVPEKKIVAVVVSNWPAAQNHPGRAAWLALVNRIAEAN